MTEVRIAKLNKVSMLVFFIMTVLLRAFNIFISSGMPEVGLYEAADIFHDAAVIGSFALVIAVCVFDELKGDSRHAIVMAAVSSVILLVDRAGCFVYDLAVSNFTLGERESVTTAVTWLTLDFLFYAVTLFASVFITRAYAVRRKRKGSNDETIHGETGSSGSEITAKKDDHAQKERGDGHGVCLVLSCLVLMVLQLVSQIVICVQFFLEYDDVRASEIAQMAGDIVYIVFRYGVILFGIAYLIYGIISRVYELSFEKSVK